MNDRSMPPGSAPPDDDPMVARLRAELGRRAGDAAVPEAGLDRVRLRIRRRHRNRQLVLGGSVVALVLVVLFGALAVVRTEGDQSFVDTSVGGMPLLGFENDTWATVSYFPGVAYGALDDRGGNPADAVHLLVTHDASLTSLDPIERVPERTVEHMRGDLQLGTFRGNASSLVLDEPSPAVWWSPSPGWTATLSGTTPSSFEDAEALLAAADAVIDVDLITWEERLDRGNPELVRPLREAASLVLPTPGRTQIISYTGSPLLWLEPASGDGVLLEAIPMDPQPRGELDTAIAVRGTPGTLSQPSAGDPSITWSEDGRTYRLRLAPGMTVQDALSVAEDLVIPDSRTWQELVFPTTPPGYPPRLLEQLRVQEAMAREQPRAPY